MLSETIPIIGPSVVVPNREHHIDALDFLNASIWIMAVLITSICWYFLGPSIFMFTTAIVAAMFGEIHGWANRPIQKPNVFIRTLQSSGLLQSPAHHAKLHRGNNSSNYCIITNILNPILDASKFWFKLEFLASKVGITVQV